MAVIFDPAVIPTSQSDFLKLAKEFDYIHFVLVDINGIPRSNVLPADEAESLAKDGITECVVVLTFSIDGNVSSIKDHLKMKFGNMRLRPVFETARAWPWMGQRTGSRILQVFAAPEWLDGSPITADARRMAQTQVNRLHARGLDIYVGWELEFRLFKIEDGPDGQPVPAHQCKQGFHHPLYKQYEPFYVEVDKRIRALGFKFKVFYTEIGAGMLEFALAPEWGLKSADDLVRLKSVVREVALDCGYKASFMSLPVMKEVAGTNQCNHSVWRVKDGRPTNEDILLDPNDPNTLSDFAHHWIAGLLHHSKGLFALWYPTVNCYRGLKEVWSSKFADWGIENRFANIRVRIDKQPFLELRHSSSASNPYLVLCGVIAAGLDGVDCQLPLVKEASIELGCLPRTLGEALEEMKKDEIMCTTLGQQFVEWYETVKRHELDRLASVDVQEETNEDLSKEREEYFAFV